MTKISKKVLLVMPLSTIEWGSQNKGGVDSVCQMLVEELVNNTNKEFSYRIVAVDTSRTQPITDKVIRLADNVEIVWVSLGVKIFGRFRIPTLLYLMFKVKQQVQKFSPDVVHTHIWSWIIGLPRKTRSIVTTHSYKNIGRSRVSFLNDLFYVKFLPNISRLFGHKIVCVGEKLKNEVEKDVKQEVRIIGNPIDTAYFCNVKRDAHCKPIKFVTCAVLNPKKQIEKIISLTKSLNGMGIDTELTIIGPSSNHNYVKLLEQQVNNANLSTKVFFTGCLNKSEIIDHYKNSDIGVFFSKEETFGLAPLEMLATGLPLLATEVGVLAEKKVFFENLGVAFVNVEQPKKMLAITETLIQNKHLPDVSALQAEFSVASVVNQYESLYRELSGTC